MQFLKGHMTEMGRSPEEVREFEEFEGGEGRDQWGNLDAVLVK